MMYLRHEAGHAFNYAYRLFAKPEWRRCSVPSTGATATTTGRSRSAASSCAHIAGWYGQKHPDEDFAETFAVWLTPRSQWRIRYKSWPAIRSCGMLTTWSRRVARTTKPVSRRPGTWTSPGSRRSVGGALPPARAPGEYRRGGEVAIGSTRTSATSSSPVQAPPAPGRWCAPSVRRDRRGAPQGTDRQVTYWRGEARWWIPGRADRAGLARDPPSRRQVAGDYLVELTALRHDARDELPLRAGKFFEQNSPAQDRTGEERHGELPGSVR